MVQFRPLRKERTTGSLVSRKRRPLSSCRFPGHDASIELKPKLRYIRETQAGETNCPQELS